MNVTGFPDPRVVGIALSGKNLRGYIPSELGTLVYLRRLNLHSNNFHGSIPSQLFNATSLHSIFLYGNNLSGSLPPSICNLPRLQNLDLSNNSLSDSQRNSGGNLVRYGESNPIRPLLERVHRIGTGGFRRVESLSGTLNLSYNHLSGKIPKSLGNLPVTVSFDLRNNNLSGEIPQTGSFSNQGPTAFLNNPLLCGFPLQKTCKNPGQSSPGNPNSGPGSENGPRKGLSPGLIVLISVADAAGVAFIGLVVVYIYGKEKIIQRLGLGIVYKVVLGNGIPVAVRRLGEGGDQRYKEFAAEVQAIGRVKHPNVVKLRAYYWAPDEKLLISDFISHGNLASALRGRNGQSSSSLSWTTRLKNRQGNSPGLGLPPRMQPKKVCARDIKPSNILLDNESQAYISDFGLNKLITITGNNPSSGGFMGGALPYLKSVPTERSNNYRAPEARVPGNKPTQKWDVYSFGVVLLELLTGKSPELSPTTSTSVEVPDLVRWVRKGFEDENPLSDMVDPMLLQEVHAKKEVLAAFHVALACTETDPEVRPRMKTVSENLERVGT
ncbi:hypothetical protein Pyn_20786 [Prunus yedoensis var. nudiflora]|uniref:Protein kinase domain-containing protein n=1 Tax=Prunus yedoensis var. nudiflora TaxID=2094558 RepID=A0A314Z892_PRUYE|nr:hypothetical protein Pyn_20786 [Prunus yedoensis var. nudiflora]